MGVVEDTLPLVINVRPKAELRAKASAGQETGLLEKPGK